MYNYSFFGNKFTRKSGILELMDDLGKAMAGDEKMLMLGGGNPAHIDSVTHIWRRRMQEILDDAPSFDAMLANYDTPRGKTVFLEALAGMLRKEYGWDLTAENIAVTNGSQTGAFLIFNLLGGHTGTENPNKVLLPFCPEYIGYADQGLCDNMFVTGRPKIEYLPEKMFKYHVDFDNLHCPENASMMCVSRPTNPTGNVLTDNEVKKLADMAEQKGIPLFIDNAYGTPFPHIIFEDVKPIWNENIILSMSLSKLGLPSTRTGIIIASKEIVSALSSANAILSLSNGSVGQVITTPLIQSGEILDISRKMILPFYRNKKDMAVRWIHEFFPDSVDYQLHKPEGSLFLWVWFRNLKGGSQALYERLKKKGVLIVPGHYFFFGLEEEWEHAGQCIRINYSQDEDTVREGLKIIGQTALEMAE